MTQFARATKKQTKLRLAIEGPAGYGKSYTALSIATSLVDPGQRVAAIDTEGKSLSLYADTFDFDVIEMEPPFHPHRFVEAIAAAEAAGYGAIILDSLSHAWSGKGGTLEIVDQLAAQKYRGDTHRAWNEGTEIQQELVEAVLRSRIHILATMRTKADYVREEVERDGKTKTVIRKAGTKTIQRDEFDYEFTIIGRFDTPEVMTIIKSRYAKLPPETIIKRPGADFARTLRAWLDDGAAEAPKPPQPERPADVMTPDTLRVVEQTLMVAKTHSPARYEAIALSLKKQGYASLTDFYRRGSEAEGQFVLADLAAPATSHNDTAQQTLVEAKA